ncbi:MAG: DUF6599 family protein [Acidobacteriota bacterium]
MTPLLAAALLFAAAGSGDLALLPPDGAAGGFRRAEATQVFPGAELYGHIDGGAEIFFEFGFERVTVQRYRRGEDEVTLELYRMSDPLAALGVYLGKCGRETPAAGLDARHTAGRHQLMMVRGDFLVIASNETGRETVAPALVGMAHDLVARIPAAPLPDVFAALLPERRVAGSERLIRGPLALGAFITLGDGDPLQLSGRITAASAEVEDAKGRRTVIVAPYPDEATAAAAVTSLRAGLDPAIAVLREEAEGFVFRDYSGRFGRVARAGSRITVEVGLTDAP